jgi:MoaA/NifB/PqqE/SkfB family radical SAM enzyme
MKRVKRNALNIIGIFDGEYAYKGPDCVQIDLTNNCNNNCIACWCNSPLLGDKATPPDVKKQTLEYEVVIRLIDKLAAMGTMELYFSGGGEPLMHPRALDIIAYAKSKGFICQLHTNFTLADEPAIARILESKLDHLVISLWAATAQTYVKTHPNKKEEDFSKIKRLLTSLNAKKNLFPRVRVYNVISHLNYKELSRMADFALETGCESAEFTVVDTIPGRTESLLLDELQTRQLLLMCDEMKKNKRYYNAQGRCIIENLDHFIRRASSRHSRDAEYDRGFLDTMPCYVGWLFARIIADGNVNSCLKAHRIPIGNLYTEDFDAIWNNARQREFRKCALRPQKDSALLRMIGNDPAKNVGCYKSCDDLGRNICMHQKLMGLTLPRRKALHALAKAAHLSSTLFRRGR